MSNDFNILDGTDPESTEGVPESTIDAKGDLLVGTADGSADNLPVGADGTYLRPLSSEATGLEWAAHNSTGDPHTQYALDTDLADRVQGTVRITVSNIAPSSPATNDLWVDTT